MNRRRYSTQRPHARTGPEISHRELNPGQKVSGNHQNWGKPTEPLRVRLVDDDPVLGEMLHKLAAKEPRLWSPEICLDYLGMLRSRGSCLPDVLLLANSIDGIATSDSLRKLGLALPDVPVILLSNATSPSLVLDAVRGGVRGFLLKPLTSRDLQRALIRAAKGWPVFCPQAEAALLGALGPRGCIREFRLTPREHEILIHLFQNRSDKEISTALDISKGTVHTFLARIYKKLGAHNRSQALANYLCGSPPKDQSLCE